MRKIGEGIKEKGIAVVLFVVYMVSSIIPLNVYAKEASGERIKINNSILLVSKVIGKEGGVLEGEGVRFEVPKGALEKEVEIKISRLIKVEEGEVKNVTAGLGGYRFEPSGIKFKKECLIKMAYDERIEEEYAKEIYTYYYNKRKKAWEALKRKGVDVEKKVIESYTNHFTDMINGTLSLPESPGPVNINLNSIKELKAADAVGGIESIEGLKGLSEGSASFNMKLQVPSGVRGLTPELAASYSSGSGYGVLGKGFTLSGIESISIDTRLGLPEYDGKDTYLINGIKVRYEGGGWKEERKQSYAVIKNEWVERKGSGNYFEIREKDGRVKIYGKRRWSGGSEGRKYIYYLDEVRDSFGNVIEYNYEREREEEGEEVILKEIVYGKERERRIKIEYEGREDVRVEGRGKYLKKESKRIREIKTEVKGEEVKTYKFNYKENAFLESLLESIEVRGSGREEGVYAYRFEYEAAQSEGDGGIKVFGETERWYKGEGLYGKSAGAIQVKSGYTRGASITASGGLGVGDVSCQFDGRVTVGGAGSLSNGERSSEQEFIDINGDGLIDAVTKEKEGIGVRKNNGKGFESKQLWKVDMGAMNREGNDNASGSVNVYAGAGSPNKLISVGLGYSHTWQNNYTRLKSIFSDVNGDGYVDIVISGKDYYLKNKGDRFEREAFDGEGVRESEIELSKEEKEEYNKSFYQQNPFRAWKSRYGGEVKIESAAVMDEGNKDKKEVEIKIYNGEKEVRADKISYQQKDVMQQERVKVKDGGSLYFVPYAACAEGGEVIRWNIKLRYEKIKPFSDIEKMMSWRINREEIRGNEQLKILMKDGREKERWERIIEEGRESAGGKKKAVFEYMMRRRNFIPLVISKEGMEGLIGIISKEGEKRSNEIKEIISNLYIYEIANERYVINDKRVRMSKVYEREGEYEDKEKRLMEVLRGVTDEQLYEIVRYRHKYIIGFDEKKIFSKGTVFNGEEFKSKEIIKEKEAGVGKIGYINVEGDIYVDRINGNDVILKGEDVYLGRERLERAKVEDSYREKKIRFKISGKGSYIEYILDNYEPKSLRLKKDEVEKIFEKKGLDRIYNVNNKEWRKINGEVYEKLLSAAKRGFGEEGKERVSENYLPKDSGYILRNGIDTKEKETLNKIIREYGIDVLAKDEGYRYNDGKGIYEQSLKEYRNLLGKEELEELFEENEIEYKKQLLMYENIKDKAKKSLMGRYGRIRRSIVYGQEDEYEVKDNSITVYVFEGSERLGYVRINIEQWDSGKDYSNEDKKNRVFSYDKIEEKEVTVGVEVKDGKVIEQKKREKVKTSEMARVKERLSGGVKQWFYGVWIKDQGMAGNEFNGNSIEANMDEEKGDAVNKSIEGIKKNKKDILNNIEKAKEQEMLYYPLKANNKTIFKDVKEIVKEEKESGKEIDESFYIGNISKVLSDDGEVIYKYFPYIKADEIYINRAGGQMYYNLPGIKKERKAAASEIGILGRSENKSEEDAVSISVDGGVVKSEVDIKSLVEKLKINEDIANIKDVSELSGHVNYSVSKGESKVSVIFEDVNGDGKADLVMKVKGEIYVREGSGKGFKRGYKISGINEISSGKDEVHTVGGSLSGSGVSQKTYDSRGRLKSSTANQGGEGGGGTAHSFGDSSEERSFFDINADGLPDSVTSKGSALNCGDRFEKVNIFKVELGKSKTYSVTTSLNISGGGKSDSVNSGKTTDVVSVNAGAGLSFSGTVNKTERRFIHIRDGLSDIIEADGQKDKAKIIVNKGSSFSSKKIAIKLPKWDIDHLNNANLFFVSDGNVGIAFLKNIPILGDKLSEENVEPFFRDGLSVNPSSPYLLANINTIGVSSGSSVSANGSAGVSGNIKIPLTGVGLNVSFAGGSSLNAAGNINGVSVSMLDMDGDGLADRVLRIPGRNGAVYVQRNLLGKVGLLKKIKLPQGGSYELKYKREGNTAALPQCKYVLSEVTARSGLKTKTGNEQAYTTYYTYEDGYYNRIEKEFYGFKTVRSKNAVGTVTETEYYIDSYYRKGMVKREIIKNGNRTYSIKEYEVDTTPHARIKKETTTIRENYNEIKTESEYDYDRYGNVTKLYDKGDVTNTNDDIIAEITYWKGGNEGVYFKAHPEKIQVLHGKTGTLLRKREGVYDSRTGALTELKQYTSNSSYLVHRIEWTDEGNIKTIITPTGKRSEYKYLDGIYPIEIKEISAKGEAPYTSEIEWDSVLGVKLKETDAANNTMSYKYDNFGRVTEVRSPYDTDETPYARYEYHTPADSFWYTVTENKISTEAKDSAVMKTVVIHDGLGRISYTAKEGEVYIDGTNDQTQTGWNISSAIYYDKAGRKTEEGMPFFYGGNLEQELVNKNSYEALEAFYELNNFTTIRNGTKYEYDDIDRNILTTLPDGHTQKTEYSIDSSLQITKAIDPLENVSISKKDARGNIKEVERLDKNNILLTKAKYEYSVLGEMLRAYDAKDNLLSVTYDLLGRRTALESKDTGKKEWIYDDKGRLYAETDSVLKNKAAEIRYEYDGFDRIVKTDYPFSQDIEYKYGAPGQKGAGQIVYKKDETGETHYKYGELNEIIKESRTINRYGAGTNPETASFEYRSDYLGRMQSMKYPDGETITYTYDKGGQLKGVSGEKTTNKGSIKYYYVDKILYDEHAQRVYIKYGNGIETRYKYDEKRRWLDSIETKNNQTQDVFQKIKYSFDPVGNVLGYANDATTYETQQTYSYDNLYQLISVEGTSNQYKGKKSFGMTPVSVAKYKQTFSFDAIGNMKEKLSTTNIPGSQGNSYPKAELDYNLDYEYDPAYAHRLIRAGTRYYRYDANGNITAEKDGPFTDEEEFAFTYSYFENEDVYGTDYGFGLDAPKETEQANPQDLFAYRRNYTWNERNLLTKSSDRNFTVHYRYGDDGQRALKYTDEGRSETLYFNNFFTIHIPTQDQNNPQGLRVHKHIFVGNSRLVTAMTHTDNHGDNEEQKAKRYYYHSDHLGSAQFVTDWKGRQYEHIEYTPYGELWIEEVAAGLDKLPFRFTGKELDEETGLYYYGARYLDPKYSRWLSGDPALNDYIPKAPIDDDAKKHNENLPGMGGVFNTVNLHVYHYAGNNPIKYTDPDGRSSNYQDYKGFFTPEERSKYTKLRILPITVALTANEAYKTANKIGDKKGWNKAEVHQGRTDAFRHAYWSAILAKKIGPDKAEAVTSLHEREHENSELENYMDINNNNVGIDIIRKNPKISKKRLIEMIIDKIEKGSDIIYFKDYDKGSDASEFTNGAQETMKKDNTKNEF